MRQEIQRVLLTLALLIIFIGAINLRCQSICDAEVSKIITPILYQLYTLTPILSLWIVYHGRFKKILSKYLSFRTINYKIATIIVLSMVILFPLFSLLLIYLGEISGVDACGVISLSTVSIALSVFHFYLLGSILYGFIAILGEIVWRGLLENIELSTTLRHLFIGCIWWIWDFSSLLFFRGSLEGSNLVVEGIITWVLYLLLSIYLAQIVKLTGTIFASSLIMGVISGSSLVFGGVENANWLLIGNKSIVTIIVITIFLIINSIYLRKPPKLNS